MTEAAGIEDTLGCREGFPILGLGPYHEIGVERACAKFKSRFMSGFAAAAIRAEIPRLAEGMAVRTAKMYWELRRIELIGDANAGRNGAPADDDRGGCTECLQVVHRGLRLSFKLAGDVIGRKRKC